LILSRTKISLHDFSIAETDSEETFGWSGGPLAGGEGLGACAGMLAARTVSVRCSHIHWPQSNEAATKTRNATRIDIVV
jgi:hypothetical protein